MDHDLGEVIFLAKALSQVLSIPEITNPLYVVIDLVSSYGLRACFFMADLELGYVVIRSPGNGSLDITADTVLQDLEHRSRSEFYVDDFDFAAAWIRNLGVTLAQLEQSWGYTRVLNAAEARLKRLS